MAGLPVSEKISMLQGSHHGAARIFQAIPMAKAFVIEASVLSTSLRVSVGLDVVGPGHPHSCGCNGGYAGPIGRRARHIKSCPSLGRSIRTHDAVKDTLAHMVHNCGLSSIVPRTEQTIRAGGSEWKSDILIQNGQESFAIDVKVINLDCSTYQRAVSPGVGYVKSRLAAMEATCRRGNPIRQAWCAQSGNNNFVPFVITSTGVLGDSARWFVQKVLSRAKACGRSLMPIGQPRIAFTWNTLSATAYWMARISLEAILTSSHAINEIIARDVAVAAEFGGRQPNHDPNEPFRGGLPAGVVMRGRPNPHGWGGA